MTNITARSATNPTKSMRLSDDGVHYYAGFTSGFVPLDRANIEAGLKTLKLFDHGREVIVLENVTNARSFKAAVVKRQSTPSSQHSPHAPTSTPARSSQTLGEDFSGPAQRTSEHASMEEQMLAAGKDHYKYKGQRLPLSARDEIIADAVRDIKERLAPLNAEIANHWTQFVPPNLFDTQEPEVRRVTYDARIEGPDGNSVKGINFTTTEVVYRLNWGEYKSYCIEPESDERSIYKKYDYNGRVESNSNDAKASNSFLTFLSIFGFPYYYRAQSSRRFCKAISLENMAEDFNTRYSGYGPDSHDQIKMTLRGKAVACSLRLGFYAAAAGVILNGLINQANGAELERPTPEPVDVTRIDYDLNDLAL